jgi:hypothetical protein
MRRRLISQLVVTIWLALLPHQATAAGNRTQVFVVALSEDLQPNTGPITQILRSVLEQQEGLEVLDINEKLQPQPPAQVTALREKARKALVAAKEALRELEFEKAAQEAAASAAAFEKMGGYLDPYERYKEALLVRAVALAMMADVEASERAFLALLVQDARFTIPKGSYKPAVVSLFEETRGKLADVPRGSVSIKSNPPGAAVYLDGQLAGYSPTTLPGVPAGKHLLVLKLPGYENWGQTVQVEGGGIQSLEIKLVAGPSGGGYLDLVQRAGQAVSEPTGAAEVLKLGGLLGLDWIWLCQLAHGSSSLNLDAYLFDVQLARIVHQARVGLEYSGYGLEGRLRQFAADFLRQGRKALQIMHERGDPLDSQTGTDDWYRDPSELERENRDKRAREESQRRDTAKGDPLDEIDPTRDW